jgi:hypothetical protein
MMMKRSQIVAQGMELMLAMEPFDIDRRLKVLFYTYYPAARFGELERAKGLALVVRGIVSRCDVDADEKTGITQFNIDLHAERF